MFKKLIPLFSLLAFILLPTALYAADETYLTEKYLYDLTRQYKTDWHKAFEKYPAEDKLLYIKNTANGCDEIFMIDLDAAGDTDSDGIGALAEHQLTNECDTVVGNKMDARFGVYFKKLIYDSDGDNVVDTTVDNTWVIVFAVTDNTTGGSDIFLKPIGGNLDSPNTSYKMARLTETNFSKGEYATNPVMNYGLGGNPFYVAYVRHKSKDTGKNNLTPYSYDMIHVVSGRPNNVTLTALIDNNVTHRYGDNCKSIDDFYNFESPEWFSDGKNLTFVAKDEKKGESHIGTVAYNESVLATGTGHYSCSAVDIYQGVISGSLSSLTEWSSIVLWTDYLSVPVAIERVEPKPSPFSTRSWSYTITMGNGDSLTLSSEDYSILYHRDIKNSQKLADFGVMQFNLSTSTGSILDELNGQIILWAGAEDLITGFKNKANRRRPVWDILPLAAAGGGTTTMPTGGYWTAYEVEDSSNFWQIAGTQIEVPNVLISWVGSYLSSLQDNLKGENPLLQLARRLFNFLVPTAHAESIDKVTEVAKYFQKGSNLQVRFDAFRPGQVQLIDVDSGVSIPLEVVGPKEAAQHEKMINQFEANLKDKNFKFTEHLANLAVAGTDEKLGSIKLYTSQKTLEATLAKNQVFYLQLGSHSKQLSNVLTATPANLANVVSNTFKPFLPAGSKLTSINSSILKGPILTSSATVPSIPFSGSLTKPLPSPLGSGLLLKLKPRKEYLWTACSHNHFRPQFNHAYLNVDTSAPAALPHDIGYVMEKFEGGTTPIDHPVMYLFDLPTPVVPNCVEGCNAADGYPLYNTSTQGYTTYTSETADSDGDGMPDACDACPAPEHEVNSSTPYNYGFLYDSNANGSYTDIGTDTCEETTENCEDEGYMVFYPWTTPSEYVTSDGAVYYTIDGDEDGYNDACDICPEDPSAFVTYPYDLDGDGIGDSCIEAASEECSTCCDSCGCSGDITVSATAEVGDTTINITIEGDTTSDTSDTTTSGGTTDEDPALVADEGVPDTEDACEDAGGTWSITNGGECSGYEMTGGCACDLTSNTRVSWSYFVLALMMSLVIGIPYVVVRRRMARGSPFAK